jgi:hypothetical protein
MCGNIDQEKLQAHMTKQFAETGQLVLPQCKGSKTCQGICRLTEIGQNIAAALQEADKVFAINAQTNTVIIVPALVQA